MEHTTQTNFFKKDDIDFKEVIDKLIASKKLVIATTLLFTILALFIGFSRPPTFISTAVIEIGKYDSKVKSEQNILIEDAEDLVKELNITFVHKKQSGITSGKLSFPPQIIADRLIKIETIAPSIEIGEKLLNNITTFIQKRHENFIYHKTNIQSNSIKKLDAEIEFHYDTLRAEIDKRIIEINLLLPTVNKKISMLDKTISEETSNLRLLKSDPQLLNEVTLSNQMIYELNDSLLDKESVKNILMSELLILNNSITEPILAFENKIFGENTEKIYKVAQEKSMQEKELQSILTQKPSTELISEITSIQVNPRITIFVLIGFMIGITLSIILVFIIDKTKAPIKRKK